MPENEEELLARVLELLEEQGHRVVRRMDFDSEIRVEEDGSISYSLGRENSIQSVLRRMLQFFASTLLPNEGQDRDWEAAAVATRIIDEIDEEAGPELQTDLPFAGPLEASRRRVRHTANRILTELI
jgi:hypothetical protein